MVLVRIIEARYDDWKDKIWIVCEAVGEMKTQMGKNLNTPDVKISGNRIETWAHKSLLEFVAKQRLRNRIDKRKIALLLPGMTLDTPIQYAQPTQRQIENYEQEQKIEKKKKKRRGDFSMKINLEFEKEFSFEDGKIHAELERLQKLENNGQKVIKKVKKFSQQSIELETAVLHVDPAAKEKQSMSDADVQIILLKKLYNEFNWKFKSITEQ